MFDKEAGSGMDPLEAWRKARMEIANRKFVIPEEQEIIEEVVKRGVCGKDSLFLHNFAPLLAAHAGTEMTTLEIGKLLVDSFAVVLNNGIFKTNLEAWIHFGLLDLYAQPLISADKEAVRMLKQKFADLPNRKSP